MASDQDFVDYVLDQLQSAGVVSARKMFGEYAVYCDGKVVALICDDQMFVKPTEAGRALIPEPVEAPPYPGARGFFLVGAQLEDAAWLSRLVRATADALPPPRPRKPKKQRR